MSEGFLSGLGLDEVEGLPNGGYNAFVFDAKVVSLKDAAKGKRLVITYKIADGKFKGETVDEWKSCNPFDDYKTKGWLKKRILSLGVPEDRIDSLSPTDLVGTEVFIKVKKNGDFINVNDVQLGFVKSEEESMEAALDGGSVSVAASDAGSLDDLL